MQVSSPYSSLDCEFDYKEDNREQTYEVIMMMRVIIICISSLALLINIIVIIRSNRGSIKKSNINSIQYDCSCLSRYSIWSHSCQSLHMENRLILNYTWSLRQKIFIDTCSVWFKRKMHTNVLLKDLLI